MQLIPASGKVVVRTKRWERIVNDVKRITESVARTARLNSKIRKVYLFGSYARGEAGPESDIDLSLETEPGFTLIEASRIKQMVAEDLGKHIDVVGVPLPSHKNIYSNFQREKILLYER